MSDRPDDMYLYDVMEPFNIYKEYSNTELHIGQLERLIRYAHDRDYDAVQDIRWIWVLYDEKADEMSRFPRYGVNSLTLRLINKDLEDLKKKLEIMRPHWIHQMVLFALEYVQGAYS